MTTNNFISIKDTALILGVTKQTLRNWDNAGKLKAHRHPFNNYRVYKVEEIDNIIDMIETSEVVIRRKKNQVCKIAVQHLGEEAAD